MKLVNLLESDVDLTARKRYVLQFQQDLTELSNWTSEIIKLGDDDVDIGLAVSNGRYHRKMAVRLHSKLKMVDTGDGYSIYHEDAQDFLDYAYEHYK